MQQPTPRPEPMYSGAMTDENIRSIFQGAGDFIARELMCSGLRLYAYMIDGLVSGSDASEYIVRPISEHLQGQTMEELYDLALGRAGVQLGGRPLQDLDTVAKKLVNGFCVVLFPGVGAIAFEVKTGEKRGLSAPEVENTVKGPKDAFTETVRTNTSLIRRHMRTPELRLYETLVGRRSLTNVTVAYIEGLTAPHLVEEMKKRLDAIDIDGFLSPAAVEEYVTGLPAHGLSAAPIHRAGGQVLPRAPGRARGAAGGRSASGVSGPGGSGLSHDQPRGPGDGLHVRLCRPGASVRRLDAEPAAAGFLRGYGSFSPGDDPAASFKGHD